MTASTRTLEPIEQLEPALPTVAACLIVRDERPRLAACLDALRPFVDDVVVADTGSRDDSIAIAGRAGALVVTVGWTDDFAAARNAALAECSTDWVLSVDADEMVTGRPQWLPLLLASAGDQFDALTIEIDNSSAPDRAASSRHRATKLLRRERCHWSGQVHERVVTRDGSPLRVFDLPSTTLAVAHHGYDDPSVAEAKAARNARLAGLQLDRLHQADAPATEIARAALDLGRSQLGAGRPDLAWPALRLAGHTGDEATRRWAAHFLGLIEGAPSPYAGSHRKQDPMSAAPATAVRIAS